MDHTFKFVKENIDSQFQNCVNLSQDLKAMLLKEAYKRKAKVANNSSWYTNKEKLSLWPNRVGKNTGFGRRRRRPKLFMWVLVQLLI